MRRKKIILICFTAVFLLFGFAVIGSVESNFSGMLGSDGKVISFERKRVVDDIYEYTIVLKVGKGMFDKIGIHRVIKEKSPWIPIGAKKAVMMVHGDTSNFDSAFLMSTKSKQVPIDQSIGVYLAKKGIDVWGIDLRWTFVPDVYPISLDGGKFMKDWNTDLHLKDIRTATKFARKMRGLTGSDSGKIFMMGHSRGAQFVYAYANQETQLSEKERDIKGIIPIDMVYKFDPKETELIENACTNYQAYKAIYDSGKYYSDEAVAMKFIALLAKVAPDASSPIMPGYTNKQVVLLLLSATYAVYEPPLSPPVPYYHYCAGTFDENGLPTGLQFTILDYMIDLAFAVPSYQSLGEIIDGEALLCNNPQIIDVPYDDYLDKINIPTYYVGAAGGMGEYGLYTTKLLGSGDVATKIVSTSQLPQIDYGHIDLLDADNAESLVWQSIYDWLNKH